MLCCYGARHEFILSVQKLRQSGIAIADDNLKRISPLMFKHLIVYGTYDFRAAMNRGNYASN